MERGDVVTISTSGDYGKPRPAVIVKRSRLSQDHPSIIVCPLTSEITALGFRVLIEPEAGTGLRILSQIMTDKIIGILRGKVGKKIGHLRPRRCAMLMPHWSSCSR